MHCGAFQILPNQLAADVYPSSIYAVMQQRVSVASFGRLAEVSIRGLSASSTYKIYCLTESFKGILMSQDQMLQSWAEASTACCKGISVTQSVSTLYEGEGTPTALSLSLDAVPFIDITINVGVATNSSGVLTPSADVQVHPSSVTVTSTSVPREFSFALTTATSSARTYQFQVQLSGASSEEFGITFLAGAGTLMVLGVNQEPPTPTMQSAIFNEDGSAVQVTFDSPTNKGGDVNWFTCTNVFEFDGVDTSTCQWNSPSTVMIYSSSNAVVVGSSIGVVSNSGVKSQCSSSITSECTGWGHVAAQSVSIEAPADPTPPIVVLSLPSTLSGCSDLAVDISASTGSGGRAWQTPTFTVLSDADSSTIENALNSNFTLIPPPVISSDLLQFGETYTFTVKLCNFLGACGTSSRSVLVVPDEVTRPVVLIFGSLERRVERRASLALTSDAYAIDCGGTIIRSGLEYRWTVYDNGALNSDLVSESQDPSKFRLAAYRLTVLHNYEVILTVRNTASAQSSTAKVNIFVQQSPLVAALKGGRTQSAVIGGVAIIDASNSYDPDLPGESGASAGLKFSWSCVQIMPVFSTSCALDPDTALSALSSDTAVVSFAADLRAVNTMSTVTVTVYDATRSSSASVDIKTQHSSAPQVTIVTATHSVTSVNAKKQLQLSGSVSVQSPCTAVWTVDDSRLTLDAVALAPLSTAVPIASTRTVNLVLGAHSLPERASLTFSLACGESAASIVVTTNGPPQLGTFRVSPSTGVELSTGFLFAAELWTDPDLPITYQFGVLSATSRNLLPLQSRSEALYGYSTLAAGLKAQDFMVQCRADIFDTHGAVTSRSTSVRVNSVDDIDAIEALLLELISSSSGDADATTNTLSIGGSVLNAANCTLAPSCTALNRDGCGKVDHTCGECLKGFVGDIGEGNSRCIALGDRRRQRRRLAGSCADEGDCAAWEVCTEEGVCLLPAKHCSLNCSGHGECVLLNSAAQRPVTECLANDPTCEARCRCHANFTGSSCDVTSNTRQRRMTLRHAFVNSLWELTSYDDLTAERIAGWTLSLSELSDDPFEIAMDDILLIQNVISAVIDNAGTVSGVSYEDVSGLLEVLNSLTKAVLEQQDGVSASDQAQLAINSADLLSAFNDLVLSQIVAGQTAVSYVQDNFRTSTYVKFASDVEGLAYTTPQTAMESVLASPASSFSLVSNGSSNSESDLSLSVLTTSASVFGPAGASFSANPMRIQLSSSSFDSTDTEIVLALVHNTPIDFPINASVEWFNTTCTGPSDRSTATHECSDSGIILRHTCTGRKAMLSSKCPLLAPSCDLIDSSTGTLSNATLSPPPCRVQEYDAFATTCVCDVAALRNLTAAATGSVGQRRFRRQLQSGEETAEVVVLDMASTATYIGEEFVGTLSAADDLNSVDDLQRVLIVILMFAVLWGGGLSIIFGCVWRRQAMAKKNEKDLSVLKRKQQSAQVSRSPAAVREYLVNYVAEVFPSVFSNKPFFRRMVDEIKRHHRYLTLFTAPHGENGDKARIITGAHLLSIQTMLMFLLAWLYDIQSPADDGTCGDHDTESDCLARKSVMDSTQSYCDWVRNPDRSAANNDDDGDDKFICEFAPAGFNIKVMIYISVIVALFVSICTKPIDMIFDLLSAPTADALKVATQDTAIKRIGRRVSNAARRMSAAAVNLVNNSRNVIARASGKSLVGTATRKIPRSTEDAYVLATASMAVVADASRQHLEANQLRRLQRYHSAVSFRNNDEGHRGQTRNDNGSFSDNSGSSSSSSSDSSVSSATPNAVSAQGQKAIPDGITQRLDKLIDQVLRQRQLLKPSEIDAFDRQWGIDPSGEFATGVASMVPCWPGLGTLATLGSKELIRRELAFVNDETAKKTEKLSVATDAHTGLELLHLFIMDLLGRSTPAARIFQTKAEEDFQHTKVVTLRSKLIALGVLVVMNAFFVYFAILTGFRRGIEWQQAYLAACLVQFMVEIVLFETMECVWINCVVPALVSDEVRTAGDSIKEVVYDLCQSSGEDARYFLNAPEFLFVSTNLAKKFPHLMESILVQSYYSHVPGELSKKWQVGALARINHHNRLRSFAVLTSVLGVLQVMGTAPFIVHRMFVRFTQPFVFTALVLFCLLIASNPIFIAIVGTLLVTAIVYVVYRLWQPKGRPGSADTSRRPVTPLVVGVSDADEIFGAVIFPAESTVRNQPHLPQQQLGLLHQAPHKTSRARSSGSGGSSSSCHSSITLSNRATDVPRIPAIPVKKISAGPRKPSIVHELFDSESSVVSDDVHSEGDKCVDSISSVDLANIDTESYSTTVNHSGQDAPADSGTRASANIFSPSRTDTDTREEKEKPGKVNEEAEEEEEKEEEDNYEDVEDVEETKLEKVFVMKEKEEKADKKEKSERGRRMSDYRKAKKRSEYEMSSEMSHGKKRRDVQRPLWEPEVPGGVTMEDVEVGGGEEERRRRKRRKSKKGTGGG